MNLTSTGNFAVPAGAGLRAFDLRGMEYGLYRVDAIDLVLRRVEPRLVLHADPFSWTHGRRPKPAIYACPCVYAEISEKVFKTVN